MNELEKKSFYSFLGLYIISSFILISLVGYWYYISQKQSLENKTYYKLEHAIDKQASKIISAQMKGEEYTFVPPMDDINMMFLDTHSNVLFRVCNKPSKMIGDMGDSRCVLEMNKLGYHVEDGYSILVSDAPKGHLGIARIIAKTEALSKETLRLQKEVVMTVALVMLVVGAVAWALSRIFMRPIRERITQVQSFIDDLTHELNTPITSLTMATEQALKSQIQTPKMLNNIAMSTKQLYSIYRSLTYLNFSQPNTPTEPIDLCVVLRENIDYHETLAQMKHIHIDATMEPSFHAIAPQQASLLFGNLISNAIKYSSANSTIIIKLSSKSFQIKDTGIGIAPDKQKQIYQKYTRATTQSGGFGIGLSIVQSICAQHNITIELDSELGEYTAFTLSF